MLNFAHLAWSLPKIARPPRPPRSWRGRSRVTRRSTFDVRDELAGLKEGALFNGLAHNKGADPQICFV